MAKKTKKLYVVACCNYEQGWACSNWTPKVGICKKVFATIKEAKNFVAEELKEFISYWKEKGMRPKTTKWVRIESESDDEGVKWEKTLWDASFNPEDEEWHNENTRETFFQISEIELSK